MRRARKISVKSSFVVVPVQRQIDVNIFPFEIEHQRNPLYVIRLILKIFRRRLQRGRARGGGLTTRKLLTSASLVDNNSRFSASPSNTFGLMNEWPEKSWPTSEQQEKKNCATCKWDFSKYLRRWLHNKTFTVYIIMMKISRLDYKLRKSGVARPILRKHTQITRCKNFPTINSHGKSFLVWQNYTRKGPKNWKVFL